MEESSKIHVGLDVHKDSITIGAAEAGRAQGRVIGKTAHDVSKLLKMLHKLGGPEQLMIHDARARQARDESMKCR
jgi:hypothetical protein